MALSQKQELFLFPRQLIGVLATAVARRRLGLQTSGKKETHTLDSPVPHQKHET